MSEFEWDPRTPPETDPEIARLQNQINYQFEFEEVVGAVFALLEKRTNYRGCRLAVVGPDLKKRALFDSPSMPKDAARRGYPILAYPLPLTNDELRYTLDVYAFKNLQMKSSEAPLVRECLRLLYQTVNKEYHERDPLTGVYNRQGLKRLFDRKLADAKRDGSPLAVLMLDLDHFKQVNDTYGHPAGDLVLMEFARVLEDAVLGRGLVGRYGGEEFLVVLPGADAEKGRARAEDIRAKTEKLKIAVDEVGGKSVRATCSIGLALFPGHGDDAATLVSLADLALYEAKQGGRNRVAMYPLDAPEVRLKKLSDDVNKGVTAARPELEQRCRVMSLRDAGLVGGLPLAVAVCGSRMFTLDGQTNRVSVYDGKTKQTVAQFGGRGEAIAELEGPVDIIATAAGRVFVVDSPSHAVKIYDGGAFVGFIGGRDAAGVPVPGVLKGSFNWPIAVAADGKGRILVAEHINRRIQRFDADGRFDAVEIPLHAADESPAFQPDPRDVAADAEGNIYVVDSANNVINKFDPRGVFAAAVGGPGPGGDVGRFKGLTAVEVESGGKLAARLAGVGVPVSKDTPGIVVAAEAGDVNRLQFFDVAGVYLGSIDFEKLEPKLGKLVRPGRLAISAGGRVYLVDQENADVLVVTLGGEG